MTSAFSCRVASSKPWSAGANFLGTLLLGSVLLLVTACSGDDEQPAAPSPEPSPATTTEVTVPGPGPSVSVSAPKPFAFVRLSATPEAWPIDRDIYGVLVYDSATGVVTVAAEAGGGSYWSSWLNETELLVRIDNSVALYNAASRSYRAFDLGFDFEGNVSAVVSPDGSLVAIGGRERDLVLADLRSMTYRVLSIRGRPGEWSPDSGWLLVQGPEGIDSVVDLARPDRPIDLPDVSFYTGWLSGSRVFGIGRGGALVVDVLAPSRPEVLPVVLDKIPGGNFSPGGTYFVASTLHGDPADRRTHMYTTAVYRLDTFERVAEFENIAVCCGQTQGIWTSDSTHFVALRNACKDGESLVMVSVLGGSVTELAQAGTSQVAVSPDDRWVAYGAGRLYIVPADGSAESRLVPLSGRYSGGVFNPKWSPDGRFIAFHLGGGDRCP